MKTKILLTFIILLIGIFSNAQVTINVELPGQLSTKLEAAVNDFSAVTNLIVKGKIDYRDIKFIQYKLTSLQTLDIAETQIVAYSKYPADEIPDYSFFGNTELQNIKFPNNIIGIGVSAFNNCSGLTGNLIIPNTVSFIGDSAFYNCNNLNGNLSIPSSLHEIGNSVFNRCRRLNGQLLIHSSINFIGNYAFNDCKG